MHILPNSKIPFANLPLDILISNKASAIKKKADSAMEDVLAPKKGGAQMAPSVPDSSGCFTLEEFNFPHAIALHEAALKAEPLIATYKKCYMSMNLEAHPGKSHRSNHLLCRCRIHLDRDSQVDVPGYADRPLHPLPGTSCLC
jgi:hypothetical protein